MPHRSILILLLSLPATSTLAEVVIHRSGDRIFAERTEARAAGKLEPSGIFEPSAAKGVASTVTWILPWVIDDSDPSGNSTFFALRNDNFGGGDAIVEITYYDEFFNPLAMEGLTLADTELVPFSVRSVPGLVTVPDVINRGFLEVETDGSVSNDVFQVDFAENFASGDRGFTVDDFCDDWRARFLRFPGTAGGTVLTFIVNGPQGLDEADPPTISGEVFTQSGTFINSFTVRTDLWLVELDALDLVIGPTEFGTLVMDLDTQFSPGGMVLEKHSAFSKFSLGIVAVCTDLPL